MLLLHQTGAVKVGEVVRYTLTYTPSHDRILPPPAHLYVKIKNTAAIPLRAAYLHGPYTLYVACYPSTFNPYKKHERYKEYGAPDFEPQLKAGGQWYAKLTVPEEVRNDTYHAGANRNEADKAERKSFTWIIEVASQVIFSRTATVSFEVLVGRDEKSLELGFQGIAASSQGTPGMLQDHQQGKGRQAAQPKGVFSKAVRLAVDDTESLWNTPPFPEWEDSGEVEVGVEEGPQHGDKRDAAAKSKTKQRRPKKVHLVLLTHGLHSNLGADMLYMKETIDTAAKQAREDSKKQRSERRARRMAESTQLGPDPGDRRSKSLGDEATAKNDDEEEQEEEQVLVRGFNGNAVRTERGIQYLGKRLAKYVLSLTYPDQPYLPAKSPKGKILTKSRTGSKSTVQGATEPAHKNSSIIKDEHHHHHHLPYRITSISFVGHSLGGVVQTYAIAYIQKHSPEFFDLIKPINFIALATPFLGLSNENPVYVKFALDFGLVGRTGQDLGLTWRAPTLAKSGWGAVINGLTSEAQKAQKEPDPGAKPLLRVLPTGPAHVALKKFRNRTVYSNVVNDGIVPLRTSCLLFLDWRGLGRVEKARRENGLVGTMVSWGWAEVTGQNAATPRKSLASGEFYSGSGSGDESSHDDKSSSDPQSSVPQAEASQGFDDDQRAEPKASQFMGKQTVQDSTQGRDGSTTTLSAPNLWTGLLNLFRPQAGHQKSEVKSPRKVQKIYRRGQTMHHDDPDGPQRSSEPSQEGQEEGPDNDGVDDGKGVVRGSSLYTNGSENGELEAPPKTSFFESAGDLLSPPLPTREFIMDPSARPRTIWHDRVYHPEDIPPPPAKRPRTFMVMRSGSRDEPVKSPESPSDLPAAESSQSSAAPQAVGAMKIEEKIARAYHKDLSWRKVLVQLEPDAHNNIIVRRMFANAYGWPVVKHLCDTHFAYTAAARTRDEDEPNTERAKPSMVAVREDGEHVEGQTDLPVEEDVDKHGQDESKEGDADRSRSAEAISVMTASPAEVEHAHQDLQRLHTRWEVRQRAVRTESEVRESRDDLSELVSKISVGGESSYNSYSSMNSGKAALSRLARQDSARWSDRFFEGSDDGHDDGDDDSVLANEIRKAQARAEMDKSDDCSEVTGATIATTLTSSPQSTNLVPAKEEAEPDIILEPELPLTAEPAELEPLSHSSGSSTPQAHPDTDSPLGSIASTSTPGTGIGLSLGVPAEERWLPETRGVSRNAVDAGSEGQGSVGIAEQVALAQVKEQQGVEPEQGV
ncbi:hypothetical protein A1O3_07374 [Capronia epimyces CBS 606.96]|uniref:DUF676 domain-containing protein n=1 Tax=Capronia epimyces CBS 606.96 TaxID=1182542 RepID=W9XVQ5_9EURO|nr:uncharacterized protein A1O3_07374 [Capronia epimyces CBS 606.96]EXJ81086.1 hypothetical protein A1O3_07374 [Capronia epimyces CBS 606.96]